MKKLRILLGVTSALCAFSALAFINNLVAIFNWWRAFIAAGGDTAGVPAHAPGCFAWLDWSAVDYSAVTTFIPLLGFFFITRGAYWLVRGRKVDAEDFPFFRGSDQLNVALGLFGTLWGIIVIGYFKLETVQMADLMQCLHTALFSTLMAVVWVFLFDRPLVRPYFLKLLKARDLAVVDEGDLAIAVERLVERLGAASDAFAKREAEFEQAFAKREAAYEKAFEARQATYEQAFEKRAAEYEAAFTKQLSEQEHAFAARAAQADAAFAKSIDGVAKFQAEVAAHCEKQLAEYEQAFAARQKEYNEFFKREIAELEKRAAGSEAKIKAVLTALHE